MSQLHEPAEEIQRLLTFVTEHSASDLHLKVGIPPFVRIGGHLRALETPALPNSSYIEEMMFGIMPPHRRQEFIDQGGADFAYLASTGDRFRVNVFRSDGDMHAALRRIQHVIPSFDDLHLPDIYRKIISDTHDGLVIVSGVTGSGKSSTLAAMLEYINQHRGMHIVTVEDPIEFRFTSKKSIISQREIGIDVPDFALALRYVVRQDPDCILIGELRDKATILAALQAAETGHLVLATLHCLDAEQTFSRILEFFPHDEHEFVRSSLANSLRAVMCQRLLPGVKPGSRYPATEVLLNNSLLRERIVNEQEGDIPALLNACRDEGMRDFNHSLYDLMMKEFISHRVGMEYAPHREALASLLKGIDTSSEGLVHRI
ncbi:MAG: PilT/PilU family type 4a pilus ATPase [Planctomycetales bacterium]|nr:PilT/PilU family type 4a pilus ATPase [Planctomycetales bacterium]